MKCYHDLEWYWPTFGPEDQEVFPADSKKVNQKFITFPIFLVLWIYANLCCAWNGKVGLPNYCNYAHITDHQVHIFIHLSIREYVHFNLRVKNVKCKMCANCDLNAGQIIQYIKSVLQWCLRKPDLCTDTENGVLEAWFLRKLILLPRTLTESLNYSHIFWDLSITFAISL